VQKQFIVTKQTMPCFLHVETIHCGYLAVMCIHVGLFLELYVFEL